MSETTIAKAEPTLSGQTIPDVHIHITGTLTTFEISDPDWQEKWQGQLDDQAQRLHKALCDSLPGGIYDRLLGYMLVRKASHFGIRHGG